MIINPYAFGSGAAVTYLDDLATQPLYARSLKKVISTATVSIRVRRSSDNAEQDIGFSGNALDTTSLASFVGSDSAYVTTFYDQTGNGYHLAQSTGSKQPRIVNAGVYDAIVRWDGTDDAMAATSVPLSQPQLAIFIDGILTPSASTLVYMEASANWNSNAYAFIIHSESSVWQFGMNSATAGTNQRVTRFSDLSLGSRRLLAALFDRTLTGNDQIKTWSNTNPGTPTPITGFTTDQTGNFGTHDHFIGGRGGSSLYTAISVFSVVCYNADVSGIRTNIAAVLS